VDSRSPERRLDIPFGKGFLPNLSQYLKEGSLREVIFPRANSVFNRAFMLVLLL
jgi:hypothetical protein